jgi:hypothetical protein
MWGCGSYESWVTMKINFSLVRLVPFGIEQKIPRVAKLLDPFGVELGTIGDGEGVIVGNLVLGEPVRNFILVIFLDVASKGPKVAVKPVNARSPSLLAAFVQVGVSRARGRKPLQNQEPGEPECSLKASLKNGRIDPGPVKLGPVDLEASVAVLRETVLV